MITRSHIGLKLLLVGAIVGACAAPAPASTPPAASGTPGTTAVAPDPTGPPAAPITLTIGVSDASQPVVEDFVARVAALSGGSVTVQPIWSAGGPAPTWEKRTIELVQRGDIDLAFTSARAFDVMGMLSLQVFQAPFLIDSDELARAVADGDIGARALGGLSVGGLTGLALIPGGLRHLWWYNDCQQGFQTLAGISGAKIHIQPSVASKSLVEAMGGIAVESGDEQRESDAFNCRNQGQETGTSATGLPVYATTAANLVLYAKYFVLAANTDALGRMSAQQATFVRDAATQAQVAAFADQEPEADAARRVCNEAGESFVELDATDLADMKAAGAPVENQMRSDVLTAELIDAIYDLKTSTVAGAAASSCLAAGLTPVVSMPPLDLTGFRAPGLPDGSYRAELTVEGLVAQGATRTWAEQNAGVWTWTFHDGDVVFGTHEDCHGTYETVDDEYIHFVIPPCIPEGRNLWKPDGDGIRLAPLDLSGLPPLDALEVYIFFDRIWTKID